MASASTPPARTGWRLPALCALGVALLTGTGAQASEVAASANAASELPFEVEVGLEPAAIRGDGGSQRVVGSLSPGARVRVVECDPDCAGSGSWLSLEEGGRVLRRSVEPIEPDALHDASPEAHDASDLIPGDLTPTDSRIEWARVIAKGVKVFAEPDLESKVLATPVKGATLALRIDPELERTGWRERRGGGFVPVDPIRPYIPTDFVGARDPDGPVAFLLEPSVLVERDAHGELNGVSLLRAFGHLPVIEEGTPDWIGVEGGWLPRSAVRVAHRHERPPEIPDGARWVHVDREQSVLTAYEGDRWVYAALVSVGTPGSWRASDPGLFHVYAKHRHAPMSHPGEYDVEAVPDVLFYNRGEALHGAFWHDDFGHPVTYGCVNLSLTDARWLFAWAPPELPDTWEAINPPADQERLWVWVE